MLLIVPFLPRRETVTVIERPPVPPVVVAAKGWGWNNPDNLPKEVSPAAYLKSLAAAAEEWSRKKPEDPAAIAQRINEFRHGCTTLIFSEHKPLPLEERRNLVRHCRTWGKKFDQHLEALEAGELAAKVRDEMDATVKQIATVLRTRAEGLET